jgi:hypothetical protein
MRRRCIIFHARVAQCGFHKKHTGKRYAELVSLYLVGSVGHVVHIGSSGAQNVDLLFSCSSGTGIDSTKTTSGHVMLKMCFLHPEGFAGHAVHFGASGL